MGKREWWGRKNYDWEKLDWKWWIVYFALLFTAVMLYVLWLGHWPMGTGAYDDVGLP